jgi:hypothetical protein
MPIAIVDVHHSVATTDGATTELFDAKRQLHVSPPDQRATNRAMNGTSSHDTVSSRPSAIHCTSLGT